MCSLSPVAATRLLEQCQRQLSQAWIARIRATEAAVGDRFGFAIEQRDSTLWLAARRWPSSEMPFDRVFNYVAPPAGVDDPLLQALAEAGRAVVIEVAPGPQREHTEQVLRAAGFTPQWQIPWLLLDLARFAPANPASHPIRLVAAPHWPGFAALYVAGYGYAGAAAAAWQTVAEHGYTPADFRCFVAEVADTPAAFGAMFSAGPIALVDGAATLPAYRGLGLQKALLTARLLAAQAQGCTYAFSRTGLGSISQRNMEKLGMRSFAQSTAWRRLER
jgi:GNAT superfamily N-acetyltransferase